MQPVAEASLPQEGALGASNENREGAQTNILAEDEQL